MATLTIIQMGQLAVNAGIPQGQNLYISVSIALAESNGKTDAVNNNTDGTKDVGVWQINDVHAQLWSGKDDRTDPTANAKYMASISGNGTNWQPWTTFNTGAYQNHMQQVMTTLQSANLTRGQGVIPANTLGAGYGVTGNQSDFSLPKLPNPLDAGKAIEKQLETITRFFQILTSPQGWIRILKVYIGLILLWIGALMFIKDSSTGKTAIKAGASAVVTGAKAVVK